MSETETLFAALRQSSDEAVVDLLERMVRDAPDHALNKMNALDLAGTAGIDEERVIAALLNAVGARHVRDDLERDVPELRRGSFRQQEPEDPGSGAV
jgi:hypothetical protein